jgi:hypothetical protein
MSGPVGNSGSTSNVGAINNASKLVASGVAGRTAEGLGKIPSAKEAVLASAAKHPALGTGIATVEAALAA